jgi:type I restriction enzyme S subunit
LTEAKADPVFIVALLESASERIRSIREGSGIPHVPGDFEHWFKFALPPLNEQQAIAEVFKANRVMADELQSQLAALRQEKAALMQQLLTGKRRVKLPETANYESETV